MSRPGRSAGEWAELLQGLGIDADATERLALFCELLERWGGAVDLFGAAKPETLLVSLVREALAALPVWEKTGPCSMSGVETASRRCRS